MKNLEQYGNFNHDESFEDLIKRIAQNTDDNNSYQSSYNESIGFPMQSEYFSLKLEKKAKEWDTFMLKGDDFKPQKKKLIMKSVNHTVQGSISKWNKYIMEIEDKPLYRKVHLQDKNCSKERIQLLENLPKIDTKLYILKKQMNLACKIKNKKSKNVRTLFLQGILKKKGDLIKTQSIDI